VVERAEKAKRGPISKAAAFAGGFAGSPAFLRPRAKKPPPTRGFTAEGRGAPSRPARVLRPPDRGDRLRAMGPTTVSGLFGGEMGPVRLRVARNAFFPRRRDLFVNRPGLCNRKRHKTVPFRFFRGGGGGRGGAGGPTSHTAFPKAAGGHGSDDWLSASIFRGRRATPTRRAGRGGGGENSLREDRGGTPRRPCNARVAVEIRSDGPAVLNARDESRRPEKRRRKQRKNAKKTAGSRRARKRKRERAAVPRFIRKTDARPAVSEWQSAHSAGKTPRRI